MSKGNGVATGAGCAIIFVWLLSALLSLGLSAAVIWGIIELVLWLIKK